ncbi:MAG: helix-turn-helix transcriptional regulator [Flavobacterium sp.]
MSISEAIKKTREAKGLSQKEIALSCKMDQSHYSRVENGKTDPSFSVVERIANALGMGVAELLATENNPIKEIHSYDKSIIEKLQLVEQLEPKEKDAFFTMLDALIGKQRMKTALSSAMNF